jgi:hypothetical protein
MGELTARLSCVSLLGARVFSVASRMFWSINFRRHWWLLPLSIGLLELLLVLLLPGRAPHMPVAGPGPRQAQAGPRVRGVVSSPLGSEEHMLAVGDFNGDGQQDLALTDLDFDTDSQEDGADTSPQGAAVIWLGDGHGGLRRGPVLRDTDVVALATLDAEGDGDADLLAGSPLLLWRNEGLGRLVPQALALPPNLENVDDLATGDMDGDGDTDIVFSSYSQLVLGLNDGRGHWYFREVPRKLAISIGHFLRVALADVDGDHDLDILLPGARGILLLNDGRGRFDREQYLPSCSGFSLAIGDLNGDARPDLVLDVESGDANQHNLGVYLNDGTGHFGAAHLSQTLLQPHQPQSWIALGDVDRDGALDLVTGAGGEEVWVRLNQGQGRFELPYQVSMPPSDIEEIHLADIDHDGRLDLLSPSLARHRPLRQATLATLYPPTGQECYPAVDQMPTAVGGSAALTAVEAAMQAHLGQAGGYQVSPAYPPYDLTLIVGQNGAIEHLKLGGQITPAVDSAMLHALRPLRLAPGRLHGRAVRVALRMSPRLSVLRPPISFPPLPTPGEAPIYAHVEHMPTLVGGGALVPFLCARNLQQCILPDSVRLPPHGRLVEEVLVDEDGSVSGGRKLAGISPAIDAALSPNLSGLPLVVPGRHHGRRVQVALLLSMEVTQATPLMRQAEAERLEAQTWRQRTARRCPGETDAQFVHRALPLSLNTNGMLTAYAWRPSRFGKQLLMTRPGQDDNELGTDLLVLDPYRPHTYALRVLPVHGLDDVIAVQNLFLADVDRDGRQELLVLKRCDLRGSLTTRHGRSTYMGSEPRYATDVFYLAGPDRAGQPQYRRDDTNREYLDDLPTVAAVRRALARHRPVPRETQP